MKKRYTPYPEKEFPVGTVIGIIALIIVIIAITSVVSNLGDSDYQSTQITKPQPTEIIRMDAKHYFCTNIRYEKGQTIIITAEGSVTGTTDRKKETYGYVDPSGWQTDPPTAIKCIRDSPYMGLIAWYDGKSGKPFYIGKGATLTMAETGKICFARNEGGTMEEKNPSKDNAGHCTVTIRVA